MAMRVLIAGSDESVLKRCAENCFRQSIALRSATGGVDCLAELRRWRPDVLVLDAELPWGGGDGVLEIMSEDDALARIPVVLLDRNSGNGGPGRFPPNVVLRLLKPVDVATLFDSVYSAADCRELFAPAPPWRSRSLAQPMLAESARHEFARG